MYTLHHIIRVTKSSIKIGRTCRIHEINAYKIYVEKSEGKRPLHRPRHRWEDNVKMSLKGIGCEDMDCIQVAKDRVQWWALVNMVLNLLVILKVGIS
jgi:hypothetical protein